MTLLDSTTDPISRDYAFNVVNQSHYGLFNDEEPNYKFITVSNRGDFKNRSDSFFSIVFDACCATSICKVTGLSMDKLFLLDYYTFTKILDRVKTIDARESDVVDEAEKQLHNEYLK